jgi:hypothetical protein
MFRLKLVLALLVSALLTTGFLALALPSKMDGELRQQLTREVNSAASSLEGFVRLNDHSLMARAERIARFEGLRSALTQEYPDPAEYERHRGVYDKGLLRWQFEFENLKKEREGARAVELPLTQRPPFVPELVFVTDDKGVGVAALGTGRYDWYKSEVARQHPALMTASDGEPRKDIWMWRWSEGDAPAPYQVGFAPIMQAPDKVVGVVVVGALLSDGAARLASGAIGGQDVAYFVGDRVVASSSIRAEDITAALSQNKAVLGEGGEPPVTSLVIAGEEHLVAARYFSNNADPNGPRAGFLVIVPAARRLAAVQQARNLILGAGAALLALLLLSVLLIVRAFMRPLEEIDQGIQEVIAGNRDYTFQPSGKEPFASEMAQALNLMSAFLQNKRMPDEEDEPAEGWGELFVGNVTQTAIMRAVGKDAPPDAQTPATSEPLTAYQARLFSEYAAARASLGLSNDALTQESFLARLDTHAGELKARHNAREIRFSVVVHDGKVVLKPHPIF